MVSDYTFPQWEIPLDSPPEVVEIGRNAHGFARSDKYVLPDLWMLHIYGYEASLKLKEVDVPIRPGYAGLIPPGTLAEYRYQGISVHLYVHFRIRNEGGEVRRIPAMQDLGDQYEYYYRRLYDVVAMFPADRRRVEARLWDILLDLAGREGAQGEAQPLHQAVKKAINIIHRRLDSPLVVEELANEVGVSYGYLGRLFHVEFGQSVVAYIQARRMEKAVHLLERSTVPIKSVANAVGIPDPHHFNKSIRHHFGLSPRKLRQRFLETNQSIASAAGETLLPEEE